MRRTLTFLLLISLLTMPFASFGEEFVTMAGFEDQDTFRNWSENHFFQRMQEKTGIVFQFEQSMSLEAWNTRKASFLEPQAVLPEVLFKAELSPAQSIQMLKEGVLIDLAPLIEEHAPNLYALLEQYPQVREAITLPGGQIAALPYINMANTQNCLWINKEWLAELKLEMPTTAEELTRVLQAFVQDDPNRNSKKDEMPLSYLGVYDLKYLGHAFGLAANDFNIFANGGQAKFMPLQENFRPFISWLRDMYVKGLIDKDGFTAVDSLRRVTEAKGTNKFGSLISPLPNYILPREWVGSYAVVAPLIYEGEQIYRNVAPMATPGTFALTSACADPTAMLSWVDYLFSEEGAILASSGLEGVDYLVDGDGTWRKTEPASQSSFLATSSIVTGVTPPGVSSDDFQRRYTDRMVRNLSEQIDLVADIATDPFPPFSLTYDQEQKLAPLQKAIGRYVDESIARWVLGEWTVDDASFKSFELELDRLGLQEFMLIWQGLLDVNQEGMR